MTIVRRISDVRRALGATASVALVPTLGALHDGHRALLDAARVRGGTVVVSLFVNPTQFEDAADLEVYPRQEHEDAALAAAAGADLVFVPEVSEIYPPGSATSLRMRGAAEGFEGASRPGHFDGVATVCLKLFHIVRPAVAFFGQKDAQQVAVVRQLVRDLDLDLEIRVVPTVRDRDGLALSSRNARLSPDERRRATAIPRALGAALEAHHLGADPAEAARTALGGLDVDYAEVAHFDGQPTLVVAVRVGRTRLIDNVPLERPELAGLQSRWSRP